jgi:hypothetical protein
MRPGPTPQPNTAREANPRRPNCLTDTNQKKLGSTRWGIADHPRGAMDADDFHDCYLILIKNLPMRSVAIWI